MAKHAAWQHNEWQRMATRNGMKEMAVNAAKSEIIAHRKRVINIIISESGSRNNIGSSNGVSMAAIAWQQHQNGM